MPDFGDVDPNTGRTSARTGFEGTVDPLAPSVSNGQISPAQWADYQSKRKRDAIMGVLGFLGGTLGGSALSYGLGGYGAAAGSATGGGAAGALPAVEGGAPWAMTPYAANSATMVGTGLGGGAAGAAGAGLGAGGAAKGILGSLSARDLAALGLSAAGTIGGAMSDPPNTTPTSATSDPNMQALIQMMQGRLQKSEPLYDSVLNMANGLLPTQYQKGGGGMG